MAKYLRLALLIAILVTYVDSSSADGGDNASSNAPCQNLKGLWTDVWLQVLKSCGVKEMHFTCSNKGSAAISIVPSNSLKNFLSPEDSKTAFCAPWERLCRLFMNSDKTDVRCTANNANGVIRMEGSPGKAVNGEGPTNSCGLWTEVEGAWAKCMNALGFTKFEHSCHHGGTKAIMKIVPDLRRGFKLEELKGLFKTVFEKLCKIVLAGKTVEVSATEKDGTIYIIGDSKGTTNA